VYASQSHGENVTMTFGHLWSHCDLALGLLTSESNKFIFVSICIELVKAVKFSQAVYKVLCSQTVFDYIFGLVMTLTVDLLTSNSNQFIFVPNHRRSQAVQMHPRARIPSNFAQFMGLRSCYRHYASKMH